MLCYVVESLRPTILSLSKQEEILLVIAEDAYRDETFSSRSFGARSYSFARYHQYALIARHLHRS